MKTPIVLTLLAGLAGSAASAPTRAMLVAGKGIYAANCAGCHGARAQGGVGPELKEAAGWSAALFSRSILRNVDDVGRVLKAPMPNWGKVGFKGDHGRPPTAAEIRNLQAYLRTLK